ncbi:MAG: hypothetical protein CVU84_06435 [Firmicutes bacterium HGW-Firmicutes-1]|jgi:hypothetical protein|nr:MAG: hypothetical protein CVU84_06435 [Firmicutes bacterium HGW-Firmicutes-1]
MKNATKGTLIKYIVITLLLLVLMSITICAAERVICDVNISSDQSATIQLKWHEGINKNPIRIISWTLLENGTLKVTYESSSTTIKGWDSRKIQATNFNFPIKVVLEEKGKEMTNFSDMPTSEAEKLSILNLYNRGIISGYADGSFKPKSNVNRAEFAKMMTLTAEYELLRESKLEFKDIAKNFWARPYILTLAQREIFEGRDGGKFDPAGNITIGEALAVINRTFVFFNQGEKYTYALKVHWSNDEFKALVEAGIVKPTDKFFYPYTPDTKATRQDCAVLLSRVLEQICEAK